MSPELADLIVYAFALPVAAILTLHGVDDLFIDLSYYLRGMWRASTNVLSLADLRARPKQRIAMMVPAWHEAEVIDRMLDNAMTTLDYDHRLFEIFVGTYPNDPETRKKVQTVTARAPNVHECVVPHDGPTSKADCLNAVWRCIREEEERRSIRFDIIVMQDSEDVIHPLSLLHYNYCVPKYDFVQTPVLPLVMPLWQLVGGTYIDEFTEHHLKDMIVRSKIGGLVPSAGVGSAFARGPFEEIALAHGDDPFDVDSLTEDYEVGLKMRLAGKSTHFACDSVERERTIAGVTSTVTEIIATREYFPTNFRASIRQRSRWICGINFQTWEKVGWPGSLPVLYTLYRDRRALMSHIVILAAYAVMAYAVVRYLVGLATGEPWYFDQVFVPWSALSALVIVNAMLCSWRLVMKIAMLRRVYGWGHSLMSIPRFPVANVVNFLATVSAARQYLSHKVTKRPLRWKKTDHVFTASMNEAFKVAAAAARQPAPAA